MLSGTVWGENTRLGEKTPELDTGEKFGKVRERELWSKEKVVLRSVDVAYIVEFLL